MELTGTVSKPLWVQYDENTFEQMFKKHFKALHTYANTILRDEIAAEEIVQNVFLRLWEKRDHLQIQTSVKSYLYKCVHNDTLNQLKHQKVKVRYEDHAMYFMKGQKEETFHKIGLNELEECLQKSLNELPEQCRIIFQMSRFEELKYKEIAEVLDIPIKKVENQIGKALKLLKLKLVDFLPVLLLWFM